LQTPNHRFGPAHSGQKPVHRQDKIADEGGRFDVPAEIRGGNGRASIFGPCNNLTPRLFESMSGMGAGVASRSLAANKVRGALLKDRVNCFGVVLRRVRETLHCR
jgi:hypothetical protein